MIITINLFASEKKEFIMIAKALGILFACTVSTAAFSSDPGAISTRHHVINTYARIVQANYVGALEDARLMQDKITAFLAAPSDVTLAEAKDAWLKARDSYGQTEAFRFYEGPIDFVDSKTGEEGPESRLNAWPLNEAYIDYVAGNPQAGIVQDPSVPLDRETLAQKNQAGDEADVATGYHAIEFLLWGQDLSLDGPGTRPVSDYVGESAAPQRRRNYLRIVTDLLVEDLSFLVTSWQEDQENYRQRFVAQNTDTSLKNILTALATLAGFELASERMATALDSGDQEDEHSCFSDNTHNDFLMNIQGMENVYFGRYGEVRGAGIHDLVKMRKLELAEDIAAQLEEAKNLTAALPHPIDHEILATSPGSDARQEMEKAITSLQELAELFKQAGDALGLEVRIASE